MNNTCNCCKILKEEKLILENLIKSLKEEIEELKKIDYDSEIDKYFLK
jgi:hypothetical protein